MLNFHNITIEDAKHHIFIENFNYYLGNNDHLAIIGEEGNGKSTLLKAIYKKDMIMDYADIQGTIETDIKHMAYFEQQLSQQWFPYKVYEYLLKDEIADDIAWDAYNDLALYEKLAIQLHIPLTILQGEQTMQSLSGGEKVKVRLLKLLGRGMELLLLDEPTNDLDVETLQWLEAFIKHLQIPVIFISHDETLLQNCANVILHMEQLNKKSKVQHTIYKGKYAMYVKERKEHREREVTLAHKEHQEYVKKKIKLNDFMNAVHDAQNDTVRSPFYAAALKTKMRNLKAQEQRLETQGYTHVDSVEEAIDVYFEHVGYPASKVVAHLQIDRLSVSKRLLIEAIHMYICGRDKIVITGRNGCGKSIFLRKILEEMRALHRNVGYMPQNYMEELHNYPTPIAFLLEKGDQQDITYTRQLLGRMKFTTEEMEHSMTAISDGQKAKLFLLRFMKRKCDVLLLDEPTRNLSPLTNPIIRQMLQNFKGCIVAVSHDRKFIEELGNQVYHIENQRLVKIK